MRFGVVVFPGSNCDTDCYHALRGLGYPVEYVWHEAASLPEVDCVVLPGGFSYGDYLRAGAIARFARIMPAVAAHAEAGGAVIGICNGFQILLEAGLLPGAMRRNASLQFRCHDVHVRVEAGGMFTSLAGRGRVLRLPIAHAEGNYYCGAEVLTELEANGQIAFRYCDADGKISAAANPNGAVGNIAGITNRRGNVLGLMPHPERCCDPVLGNTDGRLIFASIAASRGGLCHVG
ncbi:MAG: phosphoribosylformylglycinamidine synthase subunit PurQ [Bacillota bacterium]